MLEGKLGIHFTDHVSDAIVEIMPGDCVGELSIFGDEKTTAYVKAYENCRLVAIDEKAAWKLVFSSRQFIVNLLRLFSHRMRNNTESIAESLFVNTVPDIIYRLDKHGNFLFLNKTVEKLGYQVDELLGKHFTVLLSDEDKENVSYNSVVEKLRQGKELTDVPPKLFDEHRSQERKTKGLEVNLSIKDSSNTVPVEIGNPSNFHNFIGDISCTGINIPDPKKQPYYYDGTIGIIRDITERKQAEEIIYHQANYDALTDLPNRSLFMKTLAEWIGNARANNSKLALMFIDLDRFKWINDNLGHPAGDQLLVAVANRLKACVNSGIAARLGGDEFTLAIPQMTCVSALVKLAQDILEILNQKFLLEIQEVYISGSLGVAIFPDDADNLEGLLKCADEAMYRSKAAGKNAYHFHSGESFVRKKNY